jgi:hypothetical protein
VSSATAVLPAWLARTPSFHAPAAIGLALAAGATLVDRPVGLGLTLTCVALFAVTAAAAPRRDPLWVLAAALAAMVTVRDAAWVQALSVLGALVLGILAAGGFASFRDAGATVARTLVGFVPGPLLVLAAASTRVRHTPALATARGLLLAAVLVVPFAALFAAADARFAEWIELEPPEDLGARVAIGVAVLAASGALLRGALAPAAPDPGGRAVVGRTEWLIALGALNALFLAFVGLQVATFFGGHRHVLETPGLTYAEYAREGFGQLVAVAFLTLMVIAATRRWTAGDRLQRLLLGGLCVLTLIVLVSAHRRLGLYVDAFGLTRNRVFAQWEIFWLGALFALLLLAHSRPWLPRAAVVLSGVALLLLGVSNPDARVAETNLARFAETGKLDSAVLRSLSADAAPALGCRNVGLDGGGIAGFNFSRRRARELPQPCRAAS